MCAGYIQTTYSFLIMSQKDHNKEQSEKEERGETNSSVDDHENDKNVSYTSQPDKECFNEKDKSVKRQEKEKIDLEEKEEEKVDREEIKEEEKEVEDQRGSPVRNSNVQWIMKGHDDESSFDQPYEHRKNHSNLMVIKGDLESSGVHLEDILDLPNPNKPRGKEIIRTKYIKMLDHPEFADIFVRPRYLTLAERNSLDDLRKAMMERQFTLTLHRGYIGNRLSNMCTNPSHTGVDFLRHVGTTINLLGDIIMGITTIAYAVMMISYSSFYFDEPHTGWIPDPKAAYSCAVIFLIFSAVGTVSVIFSVRKASSDMKQRITTEIGPSLSQLVDKFRWVPQIHIDTWDTLHAIVVIIAFTIGLSGAFIFGLIHRGMGVLMGVGAMIMFRIGVILFFQSEFVVMSEYLNMLYNMAYCFNQDPEIQSNNVNLVPFFQDINRLRTELKIQSQYM